MPVLAQAERDAFLREPGLLMRFATIQPDGAPYATAIWYAYEDGALWFTPRKESVWRQHLLRDPRIAIVIDEQALPYRKVVVEGRAQLAYDLGRDAEWRERYRRIAERYVPPDGAQHYIAETIDQTRALFTLPLASATVRTWRMPVGEEDYSGIWAQRYYAAGTKLRRG
jgi:PPOX class probable F420-dependent enzyme